ncbi:hypothetical protein Metvu_0572 [Methanocaldococcus vulcanius M7]|uniref:Uncharacterized protein n=1 Tax=Methanocaldococcus vulcanius (strain ATCC 700851 / DSM 12094 / M7) TaxID=579137 RepID=C9RFS9_METVM|nr:hypothetical protein Metvu_0572 [Methanocaldococcus vulcanius M7]
MLDALAQRYNCLPSDLLKLSIVDFNINQAVALNVAGKEQSKKGCKVEVVKESELSLQYKEILRRYTCQ